jgi:hypothetical protein
MTLDELREYILTDPDKLGLATLAKQGSDGAIAAAINAPTIESGRYVDRDTLETFCIGLGISAKAKRVIHKDAAPEPVIEACMALVDLLASQKFPTLNLDDPKTQGLQAGLIAAGAMAEGHIAALLALSTMTYKSHAHGKGWGAVSVDDVSRCLDGHRVGA